MLPPNRAYLHRDTERNLDFNRYGEPDCFTHRIADGDNDSDSNLDQHTATKRDTNTDAISHGHEYCDAQLYLDSNDDAHAKLLANAYDYLHGNSAANGTPDVRLNTDAHLDCQFPDPDKY